MQIKKVKPKMGFIYLAKHGLKTKNWSHLVRERTVERERREEEEEEEKKKRRRGRDQASQDQEVWNYMGF